MHQCLAVPCLSAVIADLIRNLLNISAVGTPQEFNLLNLKFLIFALREAKGLQVVPQMKILNGHLSPLIVYFTLCIVHYRLILIVSEGFDWG